MAQQSARRGWKNQCFPPCQEHALVMWIRSANSHTGQQLNAALQAGQIAASDYVAELPKTACNRRGVHRWKAEKGITSSGVPAPT